VEHTFRNRLAEIYERTMMSDLIIRQVDAVHLKIESEKSIAKELSDFFTFYVPNYQYTPAFKNKYWDGQIRLFNLFNRTIYAGLKDYIQKFCDDRDYSYSFIEEKEMAQCDDAEDFMNTLNLTANGKPIKIHDHQKKAFLDSLVKKRTLLISPTGSGKSLIIYCLVRYLLRCTEGKILVVVPTTNLVNQMRSDFEDYGSNDSFNISDEIHTIFSGQEKQTDRRVVISTWQSLNTLPESYFDQFESVFGDECHLFKAKSLSGLMEKMKHAYYRFGTTGTLDDSKTHKLVIEGLFGPAVKVTSTTELMRKKILSKLKIHCLTLKHNEESCNEMKRKKYQEEIDWLVQNKDRNQFIVDLTKKLKGNTLILFNFVNKHGIPLNELMETQITDRPIYMIHGKTDVDEREMIRKVVDTKESSILLASYGTCSTGINIRNIHNIIFASPSKSVIRVLQSIGRGLRTSEGKNKATVYDISDNLSYKKYTNHTMHHLEERIKIYTNEQFDYDISNIRLGGPLDGNNV